MRDETPALVWLNPEPGTGRDRLTRAAIVQAAILVADQEGVEGLTMSAVARELGAYTAMALYRHVSNKDSLIDLMLDEAVGEIPLPSPTEASWRSWLRRLALDSSAMAQRHPWYPRLVGTRPPLGPNSMRRTEAALAILHAAGLDLSEALSYLALLDRHVYSAAVAATDEASMLDSLGLGGSDIADTIATLQQTIASSGDYPLLAQWMSRPHSTAHDQLIRGLDFLLDGIATRVRASNRRAR